MTSQDNPFVVPGEDEPGQPLCPWEDGCAHHKDYYCPVGGMADAHERFVTKMHRRAESLSRAGRLVVMHGPERTGKTSLANWCADWVHTEVKAKKAEPHIYPLRGVCPRRETVEARVAKVCAQLVDKLRDHDAGSGEALPRSRPSAHEVLPLFGKIHQNPPKGGSTPFFIILLPSLEPDTAEDEIDVYRAALSVSPGVICLTENPTDAPVPEDRGENPPITLGLSYLKPDESYTLVKEWPGAPLQPAPGLPAIAEKDLKRLESFFGKMSWNITSGKLLATLQAVYSSPNLGDQMARGLDYVEYSEFLETYLGWLRPIGQGSA